MASLALYIRSKICWQCSIVACVVQVLWCRLKTFPILVIFCVFVLRNRRCYLLGWIVSMIGVYCGLSSDHLSRAWHFSSCYGSLDGGFFVVAFSNRFRFSFEECGSLAYDPERWKCLEDPWFAIDYIRWFFLADDLFMFWTCCHTSQVFQNHLCWSSVFVSSGCPF